MTTPNTEPLLQEGPHGKFVEHFIHIKDAWYLRIFTMKRSSGAISTTATMVIVTPVVLGGKPYYSTTQEWDTFNRHLGIARVRATAKALMALHQIQAYPVEEAIRWLETHLVALEQDI